MSAEVFEKIRQLASKNFKHSHHSISHTERVYNLAVRIGTFEKADLEIIKASALLHDVARALEDEGKIADHALEGAKIARGILKKSGFPENKIEAVVKCIETHRFRNQMEAETLEARILQDSDRLDILGAIGIARVFSRGGWANLPIYDPEIPPKNRYDGKSETSINHIFEKVLKAKSGFHTRIARQLAEERHKFTEDFVERFMKEWVGEM